MPEAFFPRIKIGRALRSRPIITRAPRWIVWAIPAACSVIVSGLSGCQTAPADAGPRSGTTEINRIANQVDRQGQPAVAASIYEQAVNKNPTAANFVALGNAWLAAGQITRAADAFRSALRKNDDDAEALLGLGKTRRRSGEFAYAVRALAPAAARLNTTHAWTELGLAYIASGDAVSAVSAFQKAVDRAPRSDLDVRTNLALAEALDGHANRATVRLRDICDSPIAETRHFRNLLLVLVLADQDTQARHLSIPGATTHRQAVLLSRAHQIRALPDTAARARAIGLIASR